MAEAWGIFTGFGLEKKVYYLLEKRNFLFFLFLFFLLNISLKEKVEKSFKLGLSHVPGVLICIHSYLKKLANQLIIGSMLKIIKIITATTNVAKTLFFAFEKVLLFINQNFIGFGKKYA